MTIWKYVLDDETELREKEFQIVAHTFYKGYEDSDALRTLHRIHEKYPRIIIRNTVDRGVTFSDNLNTPIHNWFHFIEGFSTKLVDYYVEKLHIMEDDTVLDPFCGSGTTLLQLKKKGIKSMGIDANDFSYQIAKAKLEFSITSREMEYIFQHFATEISSMEGYIANDYLHVIQNHFHPDVLRSLLKIKQWIDECCPSKFKSIGNVAFYSTVMPSSSRMRNPVMVPRKDKQPADRAFPVTLFLRNLIRMQRDLQYFERHYPRIMDTPSKLYHTNTFTFDFTRLDPYQFVITSPPYCNLMSYVRNYKLEQILGNFITSKEEFDRLSNLLSVSDDTTKSFIQSYDHDEYITDALDPFMHDILSSFTHTKNPRREEYPQLVLKYFGDMYITLKKIHDTIDSGGRVIWVVGDSYIEGTYIATDLLTALLAKKIGFNPIRVFFNRKRYGSMHRRLLRESVMYFKKRD